MLYLLMFLLVGCMFYALKMHRQGGLFMNVLPAGVAVQILGVTTVFLAILKVLLLFGGEDRSRDRGLLRESEAAALWYLGDYIARKHSGSRVVILKAPEKFANPNQAKCLEGLHEGFSKRVITEEVEMAFNVPRGKRRIAAYSASRLNDALVANLDCDVVVVLPGLPRGYANMEFWRAAEIPDIYTYGGYSWELDIDLKSGAIDGFVTAKPSRRYSPGNGDEIQHSSAFFNRYFILVDEDNVEDAVARYPRLFYRPAYLK
jgi:hypothetical protein